MEQKEKPGHKWNSIVGSAVLMLLLVFGAAPLVGNTVQTSLITATGKPEKNISDQKTEEQCLKLMSDAVALQNTLDEIKEISNQGSVTEDVNDVVARLENVVSRFSDKVNQCAKK